MSLRLSRRTLFASGGAAALAAGPVFAQNTPANDDASLAAAVSNLRRAVELAPTVVSHRVELGLTLLAAGQRTAGRAQLAEALQMPDTLVTDDYYKAIARKNL